MRKILTDEERIQHEKEWQRRAAKNYYARHKDLVRERQYDWRRKNPEKIQAYQRKYYAEHYEQISARKKEAYRRKKGEM